MLNYENIVNVYDKIKITERKYVCFANFFDSRSFGEMKYFQGDDNS